MEMGVSLSIHLHSTTTPNETNAYHMFSGESQNIIFLLCAALLTLAAVLSFFSFRNSPSHKGFSDLPSLEIGEVECAKGKVDCDTQ